MDTDHHGRVRNPPTCEDFNLLGLIDLLACRLPLKAGMNARRLRFSIWRITQLSYFVHSSVFDYQVEWYCQLSGE